MSCSRPSVPALRRKPESKAEQQPTGLFYQEVIDNIAYADRQMAEQRQRGYWVRAPINYDRSEGPQGVVRGGRSERCLRLKRPTPNASRRCPPFRILDRCALLLLRPLSVGRFASLRFRPKNMAHHIFQLESDLQNIPEAAPKASRSFSVSEKLARYGSSQEVVRVVLLDAHNRCITKVDMREEP